MLLLCTVTLGYHTAHLWTKLEGGFAVNLDDISACRTGAVGARADSAPSRLGLVGMRSSQIHCRTIRGK